MSAAQDRQFDRAVTAWLTSFSSVHTRAAYERDLAVFRTWCSEQRIPAQQVTAAQMRRFGDACLGGGASAATVQRRLAAVSSFYRHAGTTMNPTNPAATTPRPVASPRAAVRLSERQADDVWREALEQGPRTAVLIALVLLDGMKSHELLRLDAAHFRSVDDEWQLRRPDAVATALHPRTSAALSAYLGSRRRGPLLMGENPTREPARLTRFGVDYLVKSVGRGAGLTAPLTVNVLRNTHTALTWSPRRESNP
jgi:integrase/recombinase XerD